MSNQRRGQNPRKQPNPMRTPKNEKNPDGNRGKGGDSYGQIYKDYQRSSNRKKGFDPQGFAR